jgi:serine/threonine protein phosphatase PrpC
MPNPAADLMLEMGGASRGRRGWSNADRFRCYDGMAAVADGSGSFSGGGLAAELAVDLLGHHLFRRHAAWESQVLEAFENCNRIILRAIEFDDFYRDMMASVVVALLEGQRLLLAHVGDCRAYRVRGDVIVQLTTDHTLPKHPEMLMRALGIPTDVEPDAGHSDVAVGDRFILATDGVHRFVGDQELRTLACSDTPARAAERLVTKARANGSDDDATCVILQVHARGR